MKKVIRTVWISLLSGLAFLAACTSTKGLTRAEKKQLKAERAELVVQLDQQMQYSSDNPKVMFEIKQGELDLRQRLYAIDQRLGNEEALMENNAKIDVIVSEIDSIRRVIQSAVKPIPCVYGPPPGQR